MRDPPDAAIVQWLNDQPPESIWITAITLFEVHLGIALLPKGRRRQALKTAFERLFDEIQNRALEFDAAAAAQAGELAAQRQKVGRPVDFHDTQIAGIALARRAAIATRNTRHFSDLAVPVVNPWDA